MDKNYFTPPAGSPPQDVRGILSGLLQSGMPEIPHDIGIVESLEELRQQPWFATLGEDDIDALDRAVRGVVGYWEEEWLYTFGWPRVRAVLERQGCRPPGPAVPPADVRDLFRHLLVDVLRWRYPDEVKDMPPPRRADLTVDEALQKLREHPRYAAATPDFVGALAADVKAAAEFWGAQTLLAKTWPTVEALLHPDTPLPPVYVPPAPVAAAPVVAAPYPLWRRFWIWLAGPY